MRTPKILITGVHTGLGYGLASAFLNNGFRVYGISKTLPQTLAEQNNFHFKSLDLTQVDQISTGLQALLKDETQLDAVILNAGILGEIKELSNTTLDEIQTVMTVNVWANKYIVDALFSHLRVIGQMVGISSGAAFLGSGGWGAYCISKSALNLLLRVYANEHPQTHFCALAPGLVDTGMIHQIIGMPPNPNRAADGRIRQAAKEGRVLPAADVAQKILQILPRLKTVQSGDFVDIRKLPFS